MPLPGKGLLRHLPIKPPLSPKHREERLKLIATFFQNTALALFLGVLLVPALNSSTITLTWGTLAAFAVGGIAEVVAFTLLRYIPVPPSP
jgi:hypothetical protein